MNKFLNILGICFGVNLLVICIIHLSYTFNELTHHFNLMTILALILGVYMIVDGIVDIINEDINPEQKGEKDA